MSNVESLLFVLTLACFVTVVAQLVFFARIRVQQKSRREYGSVCLHSLPSRKDGTSRWKKLGLFSVMLKH